MQVLVNQKDRQLSIKSHRYFSLAMLIISLGCFATIAGLDELSRSVSIGEYGWRFVINGVAIFIMNTNSPSITYYNLGGYGIDSLVFLGVAFLSFFLFRIQSRIARISAFLESIILISGVMFIFESTFYFTATGKMWWYSHFTNLPLFLSITNQDLWLISLVSLLVFGAIRGGKLVL